MSQRENRKSAFRAAALLLIVAAVLSAALVGTCARYRGVFTLHGGGGVVAQFDLTVTRTEPWSSGDTDSASVPLGGSKSYGFLLQNTGEVTIRARAAAENTPPSGYTLSNADWVTLAVGQTATITATLPSSAYAGGNTLLLHFDCEQVN
ncbi:MAG: hypothetical protein LBN02_09400 [Oscillospiraceae bacterium]|nr:hypothetical protein [Oscillospiraceae bacterium]